ncbi:MAG TPA: Cj0069 family protein [Chloroflexota bacterium]
MKNRVAIVVRGNPGSSSPPPEGERLLPIVAALENVGLATDWVVYNDEAGAAVRGQLLAVDAALVWVDPISDHGDRTALDSLLREVAAQGVLVSAHPDVILKMGTKEVLFHTRGLGWGADTDLYRTVDDFRQRFPAQLASSGPRVLKQYRGDGGEGVWKVQLIAASTVRVQHARIRDAVTEDLTLDQFMQRCEQYFAAEHGTGRLIDQAFQPRVSEGLIRCYFVQDQLVGLARQYAKGRSPAEVAAGVAASPEEAILGLPSPKTMYGPEEPVFEVLKGHLQGDWLAGMQRLLELDTGSLPLLWDADFLFGPRTASGQDSYVLCEINVSCVIPFPPAAPTAIAQALRGQLDRRAALGT